MKFYFILFYNVIINRDRSSHSNLSSPETSRNLQSVQFRSVLSVLVLCDFLSQGAGLPSWTDLLDQSAAEPQAQREAAILFVFFFLREVSVRGEGESALTSSPLRLICRAQSDSRNSQSQGGREAGGGA